MMATTRANQPTRTHAGPKNNRYSTGPRAQLTLFCDGSAGRAFQPASRPEPERASIVQPGPGVESTRLWRPHTKRFPPWGRLLMGGECSQSNAWFGEKKKMRLGQSLWSVCFSTLPGRGLVFSRRRSRACFPAGIDFSPPFDPKIDLHSIGVSDMRMEATTSW